MITPEFDAVFQWGGSLVAHCQCGRTHFATRDEGADFEPGELEKLREYKAQEPAAYLEDPTNDSIGVAFFNGQTHVWNCPCKSLELLETLLWDNREAFTRFYRQRSERELRSLTETFDQYQNPMSSDDQPHPEDKPVVFDPSPVHKELERLADALRKSEALNNELLEENAKARHSRDGWREDAERHCRNELWLRALLETTGAHFGKVARTSDDGSIQQDVLVSKVPGLVAEMAHDLNEAKRNYASACKTVAEMHEAATGRHGEAPMEGVVEDCARVRIDRDRYKALYEAKGPEVRCNVARVRRGLPAPRACELCAIGPCVCYPPEPVP